MGQQPKKYHISDDGKVYRVNDDGSFTELGNIEESFSNTQNNPVTEPDKSSATAPPPVGSATDYYACDYNEEFEEKPRRGRKIVKWFIALLFLAAIGVAVAYFIEVNRYHYDNTVSYGTCDSTEVYIYDEAAAQTAADSAEYYQSKVEDAAYYEPEHATATTGHNIDEYENMQLATVWNSNDICLTFPIWKQYPALNSSHVNAISEFVRNNSDSGEFYITAYLDDTEGCYEDKDNYLAAMELIDMVSDKLIGCGIQPSEIIREVTGSASQLNISGFHAVRIYAEPYAI